MANEFGIDLIRDNFDLIKKNIKEVLKDDDIFNNFFKNIILFNLIENKLFLIVQNSFIKNIINNNYLNLIKNVIKQTLDINVDIEILTNIEAENIHLDNKNVDINKLNEETSKKNNINLDLSFNNFVVGNFNKNAYNAVKSIFNQKYFNPMFISGGVGLGKTHLLNAIGNEFVKLHPLKKVLYVSSDEFIRQVYAALSSKDHNEIEELKNKYQDIDLLLFDDIQFLAKKDKINEIFFSIFNNNVKKGKIIIMTSDKSPQQLSGFEPRMKSRFNSGLFIEITKPNIETICEILEKKIKEYNNDYIFLKEIINYIARRNQEDIRKLEGCLHQIMFYITNTLPPNSIINISTVQKATEVLNQNEIQNFGYDIDPNIVIENVCIAYGLGSNIIKSKSRKKDISNARQVCMYVLRNKFNMPYEKIGKYFSNRNHATVIESIEKIESIIKKDEKLKNFIEKIYKNI